MRPEGHVVIGGGLPPRFMATLGEVCSEPGRYRVVGNMSSPEEFLDGIEAAARSSPMLVILCGDWLRDEGLSLLIEVQQLRRQSRVLLVGTDLESLALGHALRLGLRGLADPNIGQLRLAKALDSIVAGEL